MLLPVKRTTLFFLIIFIEGYVVLASELLAIRQLIPFVGSGTETVAIIIASVLMPLACGYYAGGQFSTNRKSSQKSIRLYLIRNILAAATILTFGLSYVILELFFATLSNSGITNRIIQTSIYAALFMVYPTYLLGQTVPLISHYFSRNKLAEITGKMLFFSTTGSFFGSIISTLILMTFFGVHITVIITISLLTFLILLLEKQRFGFHKITILCVLMIAYLLNNNSLMGALDIVGNNAYSLVAVHDIEDEDDSRILSINRSASAKYAPDPERYFSHHQFIEERFITPIADSNQPPKSILVIGAGGFTLGLNDTHNHYQFVDIDPSLQIIAEEHFLPEPLTPNKTFTPQPARAFLKGNSTKYDLIFLDAFTNIHSIPSQLITTEFFRDVKAHLKPNGIMLFNAITSPQFSNRYSTSLDNSLRIVFPHINRQIIGDYNAWALTESQHNIIYSYHHFPHNTDHYTDNKNRHFLDQ